MRAGVVGLGSFVPRVCCNRWRRVSADCCETVWSYLNNISSCAGRSRLPEERIQQVGYGAVAVSLSVQRHAALCDTSGMKRFPPNQSV